MPPDDFRCTIVRRLRGFHLDAALSAGPGEALALFGASGSGKSMTLNAVAGVVRPDDGHVVIGGAPVFDRSAGLDLPAQVRRVGYVPQQYALFPHLTVAENVAFGSPARSRSDRQKAVSDLLARLRLEGLAGRLPRQLSGGQQQRVALARALATGPRLLLLDEPFAALDASLRSELRGELALLRQEFPVTTLLVTHDLSDIHALADRVAVFSNGRVLQLGGRDEVFLRPASVEVARLTGAANVLPGRFAAPGGRPAVVLASGQALGCSSAAPLEPGAPVSAVIRPEHLRLLPPGASPGPDECAAPAVVERTLPQGATVNVWVRLLGGGPALEVAVPALEHVRQQWTAGMPAHAAAPRWAVWALPEAPA